MKSDNENVKFKLLASGKKHFLEKGFENASLRKICAEAGVSTGALYFFFDNKEDLFCQIVCKTASETENMIRDFAAIEINNPKSGEENEKKFIEYLWKNRDNIKLLMDQSKGTRYENFANRFYQSMAQSFQLFFNSFAKSKIDPAFIDIIVKMRVQGLLELINGGYSMERTLKLAGLMSCYADGGFYSLINKINHEC